MMTDSLSALRAMVYPGRAIIIGLDRAGENIIVCYAITGRSPSSQARKLTCRADSVWTEPTDEEAIKRGQIDLLLYRAISVGRGIAVGNGRQTDGILKQLEMKPADPEAALKKALAGWTYEPDAPHFTPRISGCVLPGGGACLSMIKANREGLEKKLFYPWALQLGAGKLITTYSGRDENPLPPFSGDPLDLEMREPTAQDMAEAVYIALRPRIAEKDYRVAVACLYASAPDIRPFEIYIINRIDRERGDHGQGR